LGKALKAIHTSTPRVVNVDKHAAYPKAIDELKADGSLSESCQLRQVKYLNNLIEQDHRGIKRLTRPGLGFKSFPSAWRTLRGYEAMNMIRKGQVEGIAKGAIRAQRQFVERMFGLSA
jgi:transposase-like protein